MKIAYAFRRGTYYAWIGPEYAGLPAGTARGSWLKQVKAIGFDGLELGLEDLGGEGATASATAKLRAELDDRGLPCVVVRGGGGFTDPGTAPRSRSRLLKAIEAAGWLGADTVNTAVATEPTHPNGPGALTGQPVSQGSSRDASAADFDHTARALQDAARIAAAAGITITVEVHQHSIADNSRSTLQLLDMIGSPNVLANPDLGNVLWTYDTPEETSEAAILALAPRSGYWHCKNLFRVHMPESERSVFVRVPLPDGEIDYRFAMSAMAEADFQGYLAIEGARAGDQLHADRRSFDYVTALLDGLRE